MFQLEYANPILRTEILKQPIRGLPNPLDMSGGLDGINVGKFFSRVFDPKAMVKKAPRMIAGAASGYVMGGGWGGAVTGAATGAAFKRKAGTSLFQDIYRGGLYGMIGGTAVGVGKVALGRMGVVGTGDAGLVGRGYDYINKTFFTSQVPKTSNVPSEVSIRPNAPKSNIYLDSSKYGVTLDPKFSGETAADSTLSLWSKSWSVAKDVLPGTLGLTTQVVDYMGRREQAKAAEYMTASAQIASQEAMQSGTSFGVPGFASPNISSPGGAMYGSGPSGVPEDIRMSSGYPISPGEMLKGMVVEKPWIIPVLMIGGVGLVGWLILK